MGSGNWTQTLCKGNKFFLTACPFIQAHFVKFIKESYISNLGDCLGIFFIYLPNFNENTKTNKQKTTAKKEVWQT